MTQKDIQKVSQPEDPLIEIRIFVEKSIIDAIGGIDKAKLTAYWLLVNEADQDNNNANEG